MAEDTNKDILDENIGTEIEGIPKGTINNAEAEELFESLFAGTGSREVISLNDWKYGWPAIVGGINGIPTSRQFNTLQYITDYKCMLLFRDIVALQMAGSVGVKIGPIEELTGKNMILFETLKGTDNIVRVRRRDADNKEHVYDFASVFKIAESRKELQSGSTLAELFGQIARYLADMKINCFNDADDPFVLMTESSYIPPGRRTKGSGYGLITDKRGLVIITFDRYVTGTEEPVQEDTLYGIEATERVERETDSRPYKGIFSNVVYLEEGQEAERKQGMIYAVVKSTR